jgi:hypothetical protein
MTTIECLARIRELHAQAVDAVAQAAVAVDAAPGNMDVAAVYLAAMDALHQARYGLDLALASGGEGLDK